ncbi:hypothetical protein Enr10x_53500 [Gimesia panareensis]|uniref:DUF4345 domain-containing protein n=2 Tax=Gimesia panareensis TaxID=2527978 RepID=A0A517QEE7_9PLAN|nr:hypothetical protein Enr10x_53500 [Gimesia panareensis]
MKPVMIQNPSSDNRFSRGMYGAFFVIGIAVIYFATLFRSDAWLILSITFAVYGLLRLVGWLLSGVSGDKLDRVIFYTFILLSLLPLSYGLWRYLIETRMFGR